MAERGPLDDVQDFINGIPPLTRYVVFTTLALSLSLQFGLVSPKQLMLDLRPILGSAEVPVSCIASPWQLLRHSMLPSSSTGCSQTCAFPLDSGSSCIYTFCIRISHS